MIMIRLIYILTHKEMKEKVFFFSHDSSFKESFFIWLFFALVSYSKWLRIISTQKKNHIVPVSQFPKKRGEKQTS